MELIFLGAAVAFAIICVVFSIRLTIIKRELRRTAEELRLNRGIDYNRLLTVTFIDNDLNILINELNISLELQRSLKEGNDLAEQRLKQSVSDIAHDLRTPLTVINGSLQFLEQQSHSNPKSMEYIRICREKTDRLKKMADDFFEMSLLESEQAVVLTEKVNATNLAMQFIADNESIIRGHGLSPDIRFPQKTIHMIGDTQLILRVLENLLNNAMKYASESFRFELAEKDDMCRITFANGAHGISNSDVEHLFERTYRADKSRQGGGTGLGLYIVKLLMDKQGGRAEAELQCGELVVSVFFRLWK